MRRYTILRGWHYSLVLFERFLNFRWNKKKFLISFKLSSECWYPGPDPNHSLNKITGISFGKFGIHKNSIRLAWIPKFDQKNKFEIYGYIYDSSTEGEHVSKYFFDADADITYTCNLDCVDNKYIFKLCDMTCEMDNMSEDRKMQWKCFPYFGGNARAPQKMNVWADIYDIE